LELQQIHELVEEIPRLKPQLLDVASEKTGAKGQNERLAEEKVELKAKVAELTIRDLHSTIQILEEPGQSRFRELDEEIAAPKS
jgi:hypothetical protein